MRSLGFVAVVVGIFVGILFFGGNALGVWDEIPDDAASATQSLTSSTEGATTPQPTAAKKSANAVKKAAKTGAPRERLIREDMALAKRAVLRLSDMEPGWQRVKPSGDDGPGCPATPDLSHFRITGKASSTFEGGHSRIDSEVEVFANAGQAAAYFDTVYNRTALGCIRDGIKGAFRKAGLKPRVTYARLERRPALGSRTAIFLVGYILTFPNGTQKPHPVEFLTFQTGRAVGALSYSFVSPDDPSRPCQCELNQARLLASRLYRA